MDKRGEEALRLMDPWVAKVGPLEVRLKLVNLKVGFSTADKLAHGRYKSTPGYELAQKIITGANNDGVSLADEKAS